MEKTNDIVAHDEAVGGHREKDKLELIAAKSFKEYEQMYKIVDFLNKTLKHKKVMFGLTKNSTEQTMTISIYEV